MSRPCWRLGAVCLLAALVVGCGGGSVRELRTSLTVLTSEPAGTVITLAEERLPTDLTPIQQQPTDAGGTARFLNLRPGEYVVALYTNGTLVRRSPRFGLGPGPNQVEFR